MQLGWCIIDEENNVLTQEQYSIRNVPVRCSAKPIRVHGLTNDKLDAEGVPIAEALAKFTTTMRHVLEDGGVLTSYNLEYDAGMLLAEYNRLDNKCTQGPEMLRIMATQGCCTLEKTKYVFGYSSDTKTSLNVACDMFDIKTQALNAQGKPERHSAGYDALLAGKLYCRLLDARSYKDEAGYTTVQVNVMPKH